MRIATLQFAPRLGKVESNIRRADELLNAGMKKFNVGGGKRSLDLLVLPEMAFSGYNFSSLNTIRPYLEPTEAGPSAEWARSTARSLGCTVCVGYPEVRNRFNDSHLDHASAPERVDSSNESRFNSMLIVNSEGNTLLNYQKRFLYYTDEPWANEGENGMGNVSLRILKRSSQSSAETPSEQRTNVSAAENGASSAALDRREGDSNIGFIDIPTVAGICMDINPYRFLAPYSAYEFATHVLDSGAKLVVLSVAWLTLLTSEELHSASKTPDMETFQYWIGRFWPFVTGEKWDGGEIVIVFANRCGQEEGLEGKDEARYAGTSCVMAIRRPERRRNATEAAAHEDLEILSDLADAEIAVWDMMGRGEEGVCFADTDSEPKSVFRVGRKKPG